MRKEIGGLLVKGLQRILSKLNLIMCLDQQILSFLIGAISIGVAFLAKSFAGNVFIMGIKLQSSVSGGLFAIFVASYFIKIITPKGLLAGSFIKKL